MTLSKAEYFGNGGLSCFSSADVLNRIMHGSFLPTQYRFETLETRFVERYYQTAKTPGKSLERKHVALLVLQPSV